MKLTRHLGQAGFTLLEMAMSVACGLMVIAAILTAGVALQRSYMAVEGYSIAEGDQLRVQDYIALDCRRAVSAAVANNTLTLLVPKYYSSTGVANSPSYTTAGAIVYGGRTVQDAVTALGSSTVTSATANFTAADVGKVVAITNFPTGTTISSVTNGTTAVLSSSSTADGTAQAIQIDSSVIISYYQSGTNFMRSVAGTATAIASNVDTFTVTPQDLTSSVTCSITFAPRFVYLPGPGPVNGTTIFANTFLRNAMARQ
jgi:hypothetical protein